MFASTPIFLISLGDLIILVFFYKLDCQLHILAKEVPFQKKKRERRRTRKQKGREFERTTLICSINMVRA